MRLAERIVAFERRLIDVVRVEVEQIVLRDERVTLGSDLQIACFCVKTKSHELSRRELDRRRHGRGRVTRATAGRRADNAGGEVAIAEQQRVGFDVADREHGVAAAVVEVRAERQVGAEVVAVTTLGDLLVACSSTPAKCCG